MSGNHSLLGQEADADGQTRWRSQGDGGTHYVAPSLNREDGNVGFWRIPHSLQSHPTLLQTQDCVRTSRSRPVLDLYLRVPAPSSPLREVLIGVDSGTHDQLTEGDTSGQRETPAHPAQRHGPNPLPSWRMESRRMTAILGIVGPVSCT